MSPLKKSTGRIKSRTVEGNKQNSDFEFDRASQLNFQGLSKLPSGLLTSTGTFMFCRSCPPEKSVWQLASMTQVLFKKQSREMYEAETAS